ncbi:MAG: hypothetical protein J6Y02_23405 [Pseudobutyrivibrio sp.]|nr:hypothetical protein [Pseudobutyrivibrio sp.]
MFGTIYLTSDLAVVERTLQTRSAKVVVIDEENPFPQAMDMITMASILLPPYEALSAMVDGEIEIFRQIYFDYLNMPDPAGFMAILIMCIYRGINLLFYIPNDEADFIAPLIGKFSSFGVMIGDQARPFFMDPAAEPFRLSMVTYYGVMSAEEYLQRLPIECPVDPNILPMLIKFYNPHLPDYSIESYLAYFKDLCNKMHRNGNKPVRCAFLRSDA